MSEQQWRCSFFISSSFISADAVSGDAAPSAYFMPSRSQARAVRVRAAFMRGYFQAAACFTRTRQAAASCSRKRYVQVRQLQPAGVIAGRNNSPQRPVHAEQYSLRTATRGAPECGEEARGVLIAVRAQAARGSAPRAAREAALPKRARMICAGAAALTQRRARGRYAAECARRQQARKRARRGA